MSTFGVTLVLVLCTFQHSIGIPRPDFGVDAPVYGSGDVSVTANKTGSLIGKVNLTLDVQLTSGYTLLTTVKTQLIGIANDFTKSALAVSGALDTLALSTGPLEDAFARFVNASSGLTTLLASGLTSYLTELDAKLDNSISTMLDDAFQDVTSELTTLGSLLTTLKGQLQQAVSTAGSNTPSKAVLRKSVSTNVTSAIAKSVMSLKANIPLVTYIIANSVENLKTADGYINASGTVASDALDEVSKGLEQLETEVQLYSDDASQIATIIMPVYQANFNFSSVNLSSVPLIQSQLSEYTVTYTSELNTTISDIKQLYETYKQAIPLVSDGLTTFYSTNACNHLVRLVKVLISNGPYGDYCYSKYSSRSFALFDQQTREASRCVDQEITRLLKLQEVLLAIAKILLFNIEDILAQATICAQTPLVCNTNDIEATFNKVNMAARSHQNTLRNIVNQETVAGLKRLSACFSTSKYMLVVATNAMVTEIDKCATLGPSA